MDDYLRMAAKTFVFVNRPWFQFWGYVVDELGEQL